MGTISKDAARRLALKSCRVCRGRGGKSIGGGMIEPCRCVRRLSKQIVKGVAP